MRNGEGMSLTPYGPVLFYGHRAGPWAPFSNFYPVAFELGGITWHSSEQAFMYGKSDDPEYKRAILGTRTAWAAKKLGRTCTLRPEWETIKVPWMGKVLRAKFSQVPMCRELLLSTGERPIHESCQDSQWGGGPLFPNGRDLLGKCLVDTRTWLRQGTKEGSSCPVG